MIESFRHKGSRLPCEADDRSKLPAAYVQRIQLILAALDVAEKVADLNVHSFRLHGLNGNLRGAWSITVRANWRIVLRFEPGAAFDVDLLDNH